MAVWRVHKEQNYTAIANSIFRNKELSLSAKGFLGLVMTLPDDWKYSKAGLETLIKEGRDKLNTTLKELKTAGYLTITQTRNENGTLNYIYEFFEEPHSTLLHSEIPHMGLQHMANPQLLNKDIQSKEILNTEYTYCTERLENHSVPSTKLPSLTLNDKSPYNVTEQDLERYKELYPAVDVEQEIKKMAGWLDANPTRRKTKKGIKKFINSWLSKEQDRGGVQSGHRVQPMQQYSADVYLQIAKELDEENK